MNKLLNRIAEKLKKISFFRAIYRLPGISSFYHFLLAFFGSVFYGQPSRRLKVIGVTGTKGKTTTVYLLAQILETAGPANGVNYKVGMATTALFKIGEREWTNTSKQTVLGRFELQKLLADMVKAGCDFSVVEISSEAILQHRHRFIDFDAAIFTNLSPEHIERHGSFEKYRAAKVKLFQEVAKKENGIGIYNLDDENVKYFLEPEIKNKIGYILEKSKIKNQKSKLQFKNQNLDKVFEIKNIELSDKGTKFSLNGEKFEMPLLGEFNVYNAAAAVAAAFSQNIPPEKIKEALKKAKAAPGRMEILDSGRGFKIIIDYAHEPKSLESLYEAVKKIFQPRKTICVLGAQGGGRDKWKRPAMGKIAAQYCDEIVLTNEDSYDEPPLEIINDIEKGIGVNQPFNQHKSAVYKIVDRREAIKKAISLAGEGDAVILSGKGGEVWMCVANGKKIPWDEKGIVDKLLK